MHKIEDPATNLQQLLLTTPDVGFLIIKNTTRALGI
jgi:hypothetical protein